MSAQCFILDFDGTFTDVEREAEPFIRAYRDDLAERFGRAIVDSWEQAVAEVRREPHRHGWKIDGYVVAPGNSDPYVRATVSADLALDRHGLVQDPQERTQLLQQFYAHNYRKAAAVFRPEAKRVLERILGTHKPVYVVSNSETTAVEAKLAELAPRGGDRLQVVGNAKKYMVAEPPQPDALFDALPTSIRTEGLQRPLFLRRGHYYETLRRIWEQSLTGPESTIVVGDIYELDLAMPAHFGAHVHLLTRETTPSHERRAVEMLDAGSVSEQLDAVLDHL